MANKNGSIEISREKDVIDFLPEITKIGNELKKIQNEVKGQHPNDSIASANHIIGLINENINLPFRIEKKNRILTDEQENSDERSIILVPKYGMERICKRLNFDGKGNFFRV